MEEETADPNGVEVRFAVEDRWDFDKFRHEACHVYEYFKLRPVISGYSDFKFKETTFKEKDIVPGVHTSDNSYNSYAIMGNIKYPIDVPNAEKVLGGLHHLLSCGLVMEFGIGELDFQASREGLSYIPQTINAIKNKLEALNAQLAVHIAERANKIENLWDRAVYLNKMHGEGMWNQAVNKYVADTKFELFDATTNRWNALKTFKFSVSELASKYNISIRAFSKSRSYESCSTIKVSNETVHGNYVPTWEIRVGEEAHFVFTDTKVGAFERAKYHWRKTAHRNSHANVYVIEAADKAKPMLNGKFLKALSSPPADRVMNASDLLEKERSGGSLGKNVTIMHLVQSNRSRNSWGYSNRDMVWHDAGKADTFDSKETYYYLPLSGYQSLGIMDPKDLHHHLSKSGLFDRTIYGVRKADMEWVKLQKNWINLDDHVRTLLGKLGTGEVMSVVKKSIDFDSLYQYNAVKKVTSVDSPYVKLYNVFKDVKSDDSSRRGSLEVLCGRYSIKSQVNADPSALIKQYSAEANAIHTRYPLLKSISRYSVDADAIAEYINLIDAAKGV